MVGHRQQVVADSPRSAKSASAEMGGVHGDEALAESAGVGQHRGRRLPVGIEAGLVLGWLLGDVGVQRKLALSGPGGDDRRGIGIDGANAVDRGSDPHPRAVLEFRDAVRPCLNVGVGEAPLRALGLGTDASVQVARVDQRDPHPGLGVPPRSAPSRSHSGRRTGSPPGS